MKIVVDPFKKDMDSVQKLASILDKQKIFLERKFFDDKITLFIDSCTFYLNRDFPEGMSSDIILIVISKCITKIEKVYFNLKELEEDEEKNEKYYFSELTKAITDKLDTIPSLREKYWDSRNKLANIKHNLRRFNICNTCIKQGDVYFEVWFGDKEICVLPYFTIGEEMPVLYLKPNSLPDSEDMFTTVNPDKALCAFVLKKDE